MTSNKSIFINFIKFDGGNLTFGDDNMARVKSKTTICAPSIPTLEEVLHIKCLKANLVSINQIRENEFNI